MKRFIEIRGAEGGKDATLFTRDLAKSYQKMATRFGWKSSVVKELANEIHLAIEGSDLSQLEKEAGGHRIQRIPPTERNGRVHTSTVTVAVVSELTASASIDKSDLRIEWYSGTGPGGQHRNKHQNSCRITHVPTGIVATSQTRSRNNSLAEAMKAIEERVYSRFNTKQMQDQAVDRKTQVGSGMRGDKIRTYRFQDDMVKDHNTERTATCGKVLEGYFDLLW